MILETKEKINLYYRDGRSDKVYQVQLDRVDGGYVVNFQFGRRGSTLQTGTKTPQPQPYENAAKVYNLLVAQKIAKGYRLQAHRCEICSWPSELGWGPSEAEVHCDCDLQGT